MPTDAEWEVTARGGLRAGVKRGSWLGARWHHLAAELGIGGKDAVVSQHVKVWRRDERTKAADEIHWVEQDGMGPVAPALLEALAYASIGMELEALLAQRGPCDVAAQALEALSVPAIDGHRGVDVYPTHLGDGERVRLYQREPRGPGELGGPLTRSRAQELQVPWLRWLRRNSAWS